MGFSGRKGRALPGKGGPGMGGGRLFLWGSRKEKEGYLRQCLAAAKAEGLGPEEILVLTFYQETQERLRHILQEVFSPQKGGYHVATLHNFCLGLLNREGFPGGFTQRPEVIRGWKEFIVLKNLLPGLTPQGYRVHLGEKNGFVRQVLAFFKHLMAQGVTAAKLQQKAAEFSQEQLQDLATAYTRYAEFCRQEGYLPLAAVVPEALCLVRADPALLKDIQGRRQLLIVDDLDLLEPIQLEFIRYLAPAFPRAVGLAYKNFTWAAGADREFLHAGEGGQEKVCWREYATWEEEIWSVAGEVGRLLAEGEAEPSEVAIFLGSPSQRQAYARALTAAGIPCRPGPEEEVRRDLVLDFLLAYLEALAAPEDNGRQVRWLSSPLLNLEGVWLRRIYYQAQGRGQKLLDMLTPSKIRELVETFRDHLRGLEAGSITPLTIIEELCATHRLFPRYLEKLEGGEEGQEALGILANLREFLQLARECEGLYRQLQGRNPNLTQFLEQLKGALPYLNMAVRAAGPRPEGVVLAPLRDAPRYSPRRAFLVGMAAGIYPRQRIPSPLLPPGGWEELQGLFPHLKLPQELDPRRFWEEQRATLGRALAAGDQVGVSWARSYPGLEETGPSELLGDVMGEERGEESSPRIFLAWPEPRPGLATAERLGRFYLCQVSRVAPPLLPQAREGLEELGVVPGEVSLPAKGEGKAVAPVGYYTPSAIKNYLTCPRRYYYLNILGLAVPAHPRARMGLFLHRILEEFHRRLPTLAGIREEKARAVLSEVLEQVWCEVGPSLGKGLLAALYRQEARAVVYAYLERELAHWEEGRRAWVEESLDFTLGSHRLRGRLDRLDEIPGGGWEIIDYKMGRDKTEGKRKREFLPREGERPQDLQLIIYCLGAQRKGLPLAGLTWYQLAELVAGGKVKRSLTLGEGKNALSCAELKRAEEILRAVLEEMGAGQYPPSPRDGQSCRDCPFKFPCPGPQ